jgi:hypothetical protein
MKANMASAAVVELAPILVLRGLRNSARTACTSLLIVQNYEQPVHYCPAYQRGRVAPYQGEDGGECRGRGLERRSIMSSIDQSASATAP